MPGHYGKMGMKKKMPATKKFKTHRARTLKKNKGVKKKK
jgi:hypothetical protein